MSVKLNNHKYQLKNREKKIMAQKIFMTPLKVLIFLKINK